jgi:hypothetical protein
MAQGTAPQTKRTVAFPATESHAPETSAADAAGVNRRSAAHSAGFRLKAGIEVLMTRRYRGPLKKR